MYEGYEGLKISRGGAILTIQLSNPWARNAVNATMHDEIGRVFKETATDRETRVIVLTGDPEGGAFCAGGDLKWIETVGGKGERYDTVMREGIDALMGIVNTPQPVIAMVNGHAMGLGATLALYCDLAYVSTKARIADPHVSIGVVAGDGGAAIWPLLIGPNRAKEFLMTGDALTGEEAANIGLVNHAVSPEELEEKTYAMANKLCTGARLAIELTKRSVNIFLQNMTASTVTASLAMEGLTFATADHREAVRAFLSKESPQFGQSEDA